MNDRIHVRARCPHDARTSDFVRPLRSRKKGPETKHGAEADPSRCRQNSLQLLWMQQDVLYRGGTTKSLGRLVAQALLSRWSMDWLAQTACKTCHREKGESRRSMECRSNGLCRDREIVGIHAVLTFNGGSDTTLPEGKGAVLQRICQHPDEGFRLRVHTRGPGLGRLGPIHSVVD